MRKSRKFAVVAGSTVGALAIGGVAFAYWTTSGSGTGSAATTSGAASAVTINQAALTAMFPGDTAQNLKLTATNNDATQSVHVSSVSGVLSVTTSAGSCDATDFKVDGAALSSTGAFSTAWSPVEVGAGLTSAQQTVATVQFNNKVTSQDGCKGAVLSIAYTSN